MKVDMDDLIFVVESVFIMFLLICFKVVVMYEIIDYIK